MEYSDGAIVKIGKFSGEGYIVYKEEENRFTVGRTASASNAGIVVGVMFGALGRAIMDGVSGDVELATFTPQEIRHVDMEEKPRKTTFTLHPANGDAPYVITIKNKKQLCTILRRELVEQKPAALNPGASAPEPFPSTRAEPLREEPPAPVQPPVQAPIQAPPQPMQPIAPVQPIQPVAPVQPMQPMQSAAPMQPVQPPQPMQQPQYNPYGAPQGYAPQQPMPYPPQQPVRQPPQPMRQSQPSQPAAIRFHVSSLNTEVSITMPAFTVGRDATSDLNLARLPNAKYIARRQATVFFSGGKWYIRDENSTNGTLLNNRPLPGGQPHVLSQGDFISFAGKETLIVQDIK